MVRRLSLGVVAMLVGLAVAARCGNQQECTLNSDCLPGRFCSSNNFCEFQCRGKEDCEGCGVCDLRYGICIKKAPADFDSLGACCIGLADKSTPMTTEGVCLAGDAGVAGDGGIADTVSAPGSPDASPDSADGGH